MKRVRSTLTIPVLVLALLGVGVGCTSDKPAQHNATSSSASAITATAPAGRTVTATPSSALHDGDQIQVHVGGFAPNERVRISECASPQDVNMGGCGLQPAQQPFLDLDDHGNGSINFVAAKTASNGPVAHGQYVTCVDQCVLAVVGVSGTAYAPLSFTS